MKFFLLTILSCLLLACSTTTTKTAFTKQQEQESQALAVLSSYSGDVLAAAALPLQYYCHHQQWPASQNIDVTQPLVSNLLGLYYVPVNKDLYKANFGLLDQATQTMTNWQVIIPLVNPAKTSIQKVKLEIINDDFSIHLVNVMDFQCRQAEALNVNKTKIQPNKAK